MKISIDVRRAGDFGIGTYIRNIVNQLAQQDRTTQYLLIGRPQHLADFDKLPSNFELLPDTPELGSSASRLLLPLTLRRREVDLLHLRWFQPLISG